MGDVRFKLRLAGIRELFKSPEVQECLDKAGEKIKNIAGPEYGTSSKKGKYMGFCNIFPNSKEAAQDNYDNNTLAKALTSSGLRLKKK